MGAYAQDFVPNWSFEDHTQCPDSWNEVERATGWFRSLVNNNPLYHSDYLNACAAPNFSVPSNVWGSQTASTGVAYMAQVPIAPEVMPGYRENIYAQLVAPLQQGIDYDVHFQVSFTDNSQHAANNIGVKFSTVPYFPIDGVSQVYTEEIITDRLVWTEISGSFTADSAYTYIAVGNFFPDDQTLTSNVCPSCSSNHYGYYIDDVCVVAKHGGNGDCAVQLEATGISDAYGSSPLSIVASAHALDVRSSVPLPADGTMTLFDLQGRQVLAKGLLRGGSSFHADLGRMPAGVYMVQVAAGTMRRTQRFVIVD